VEILTALAGGFAVALTPQNLLWSLAGVTLGTAIGVLPGIGPALTVALLLPITYSLDPTAAFIMFAGIYYGGMYGGSTTSILLNTPGESASVMSAVEGNLMARAGRGGAALATAAIGSFVAGTLGTAALTVCAPVMVEFALRFGPAEYFSLAVLAFVAVSAMLGESRLHGFASLLFGLLDTTAHYPATGALQCDSDSGERRRVQREPLYVRRRPAVRDRRRRVPDAAPLRPACTGDHRRDPGTDGRTAVAPRAGDCRRGSDGVRHAADLVGVACGRAAAVNGTSTRQLGAPAVTATITAFTTV
jgi:hypothetical protein